MNKDFCYLLKVRYYECDAQHVVFNARYGDYIDTASTEFFRAVFGDYKQLLARNLDCQLVKQTTQWKAPARFDDVLVITVSTISVGTSSFTLGFTLHNFTSEQVIAECETIYVMVQADNFSKTPVPDDVRKQLLAGAPGIMTNHAGVELKKSNAGQPDKRC